LPGRARIEGSWTFVSLNFRLESDKEEKKVAWEKAKASSVNMVGLLDASPNESGGERGLTPCAT